MVSGKACSSDMAGNFGTILLSIIIGPASGLFDSVPEGLDWANPRADPISRINENLNLLHAGCSVGS